MSNLLDDIANDIANLSDDDLKAAAEEILAARERAKARPLSAATKERMREREKRRRKYNSELLKIAREKGLVPAPRAQA